MAVKKIAIFGATGNTGLTTLAQAVQAGMELGRAGSVMVDPQDWGQCMGWGVPGLHCPGWGKPK